MKKLVSALFALAMLFSLYACGGTSSDTEKAETRTVTDACGRTVGYRAALYAAELLGIEPSPESGAACLAENDKCPTDAMRAVFGCTEGNGRLTFDLTGEQVFTVTSPSGKAVRLAFKNPGEDLPRDGRFKLFHELPAQDMFDVTQL